MAYGLWLMGYTVAYFVSLSRILADKIPAAKSNLLVFMRAKSNRFADPAVYAGRRSTFPQDRTGRPFTNRSWWKMRHYKRISS